MKPEQLLYSETHEWVQIEETGRGKQATVGITKFAVEQLTDLVFMDLPELGSTVTAGEEFGEVESVKAVSPLYSPVSGEVVAVNSDLANKLEILSTDPYQAGWMVKVRITDETCLGRLMNYAAYQKQCAEES